MHHKMQLFWGNSVGSRLVCTCKPRPHVNPTYTPSQIRLAFCFDNGKSEYELDIRLHGVSKYTQSCSIFVACTEHTIHATITHNYMYSTDLLLVPVVWLPKRLGSLQGGTCDLNCKPSCLPEITLYRPQETAKRSRNLKYSA